MLLLKGNSEVNLNKLSKIMNTDKIELASEKEINEIRRLIDSY